MVVSVLSIQVDNIIATMTGQWYWVRAQWQQGILLQIVACLVWKEKPYFLGHPKLHFAVQMAFPLQYRYYVSQYDT